MRLGNQTHFFVPDPHFRRIWHLIMELGIHRNWLFGYEGKPQTVMYMKDLVHKSEVEKLKARIRELKDKLGEVYKQLAQERRVK